MSSNEIVQHSNIRHIPLPLYPPPHREGETTFLFLLRFPGGKVPPLGKGVDNSTELAGEGAEVSATVRLQ